MASDVLSAEYIDWLTTSFLDTGCLSFIILRTLRRVSSSSTAFSARYSTA